MLISLQLKEKACKLKQAVSLGKLKKNSWTHELSIETIRMDCKTLLRRKSNMECGKYVGFFHV